MREPDRIVRLKTVLARTGLSRSTIYRKIAEGTFPAQIKISTNGTGWHESDINRWIADPVAWRPMEEVDDGRQGALLPFSARAKFFVMAFASVDRCSPPTPASTRSFRPIARPVVGTPDFVLILMPERGLDHVGPETPFVQYRSSPPRGNRARSFILSEAHAPQRGVHGVLRQGAGIGPIEGNTSVLLRAASFTSRSTSSACRDSGTSCGRRTLVRAPLMRQIASSTSISAHVARGPRRGGRMSAPRTEERTGVSASRHRRLWPPAARRGASRP